MRVPNATFFGEFKHDDIRLYEHDDLHRTTCYYGEPLYQSAKDDKTLAFIPRRNFERMSPLDRGRLVREECHAIALERVIIPAQALGVACDAERAYFYALHRICTDLATGWFREFAIESFEQLARPDVDFTGRFAHAVDTGSRAPAGRRHDQRRTTPRAAGLSRPRGRTPAARRPAWRRLTVVPALVPDASRSPDPRQRRDTNIRARVSVP